MNRKSAPKPTELERQGISDDALIAQLLLDARRAIDPDRDLAKLRLDEAILILAGSSKAAIAPSTHKGPRSRQIDHALRYIEENLHRPLRVSQIARNVGLSSGYFCNAFKASVGQPPRAYLIACRIGRAERLMQLTDMRLVEIAIDCGFSDQAHFCRAFRASTGTSPNAWRLSNGGIGSAGKAARPSGRAVAQERAH